MEKVGKPCNFCEFTEPHRNDAGKDALGHPQPAPRFGDWLGKTWTFRGFLVCFFGGIFPATIAAAEATKLGPLPARPSLESPFCRPGPPVGASKPGSKRWFQHLVGARLALSPSNGRHVPLPLPDTIVRLSLPLTAEEGR